MSRPKKPLDLGKVAGMRAAGLSYRAIARACGTSHVSIWKLLINTSADVKVNTSPLLINTPQNPSSEMERNGSSPAPPCASPTSEHPPSTRLPQLAFASIHRYWFSCAYAGKQPELGKRVDYANNSYYVREEKGQYRLEAHPHRLKVWVYGITGQDTPDLKARARGRARAILGEIAREWGLVPDWKDFRETSAPEYVLTEEPLNQAVMAVAGQDKEESRQKLGGVPGDSTHQRNFEAKEALGEATIDGLAWMSHELPEDVRMLKAAMEELRGVISLLLKNAAEQDKALQALLMEGKPWR